MKILIVIDQYFFANNGMTISARRFTEVLRQHGHEVRLLCTDNREDPELSCREQHIPVFQKLVSSQGMTFAHTNRAAIEKGIAWANVIHLHVPFMLSHTAMKMAQATGKPYTSAFHVQPENISSSIHMAKITPVNTFIYWWFRQTLYKNCPYIHCPTQFIADELKAHRYPGKMYVISNGVDPDFTWRKQEKPQALRNRFVILSTGRYSIEKRQDILIKAAARSRYSQQIQLILAGQGPRKKALEKLSRRVGLKNPPIMKFMDKEELMNVISFADLYVHCAESEIEGMSCIEAFCGGLVPVIAKSPKSAAKEFALHPESLFEVNRADELARKIDYWIEHPLEKDEYERKYSNAGAAYNIDACVRRMEKMFQDAIEGR